MVQKQIDYRPCPTVELEKNDYLVEIPFPLNVPTGVFSSCAV